MAAKEINTVGKKKSAIKINRKVMSWMSIQILSNRQRKPQMHKYSKSPTYE